MTPWEAQWIGVRILGKAQMIQHQGQLPSEDRKGEGKGEEGAGEDWGEDRACPGEKLSLLHTRRIATGAAMLKAL